MKLGERGWWTVGMCAMRAVGVARRRGARRAARRSALGERAHAKPEHASAVGADGERAALEGLKRDAVDYDFAEDQVCRADPRRRD